MDIFEKINNFKGVTIERHWLGAALYALSIVLLSILDVTAKWLTTDYHFAEIILFRSVFSIPLLLLIHYKNTKNFNVRTSHWRILVVRGLLMVAAASTFYISVQYLPLATAIVISLSNALFMVIFEALLLRKVDYRVLCLTVIGFFGVILAVDNLIIADYVYVILAITSSSFYASVIMYTKRASIVLKSEMINIYSVAVMLALSLPIALFYWKTPTLYDFSIFSILGLAGGIYNYTFTVALKYTTVSKIAPIEYSILIWAALFGYLIFAEIPTMMTILGAAIIVAAILGNTMLSSLRREEERRVSATPPQIAAE